MPASRFRLDRALSLGLVHRASQLLDGHRQPRIPILMYHSIRADVGTTHPYFETRTSPQVFLRHMQFLSEDGYTTMDLGDAIAAIATGCKTQKCVALTFDDGYRDFYTHAFPILAEYGFTATVFVVSGLTGEQRIRVEDKEFMTWNEVRHVHSSGIRIGSHTATHPELYSMKLPQIQDELWRSKSVIEDKLGTTVQSFAYPFAFPEQDREFIKMLKELLLGCGYQVGVSTIIGTARRGHDHFLLPRLPVNSYDDLRFFDLKLNGGYDWLHAFQYAWKRVKSIF